MQLKPCVATPNMCGLKHVQQTIYVQRSMYRGAGDGGVHSVYTQFGGGVILLQASQKEPLYTQQPEVECMSSDCSLALYSREMQCSMPSSPSAASAAGL